MDSVTGTPATRRGGAAIAAIRDRAAAFRRWLPQGGALAQPEWDRRHRAILIILTFYIVGLVAFGVFRGYGLQHVAIEGGAVAIFAMCALQPFGGRKLRSTLASIALLTAASIGVHLSGGKIEAHFQFFVVITLLMLYQDWLPFLVAIAYVVAEHGIIGVLLPTAVYNHAAAQSNPWLWAGIHGGFVLAASAANLAHWRLSEDDHKRAQDTELSYQRLFAGHPQPMWVYDGATLRFLEVNDAAIAHYGYSRDEFLAMTIKDIRPPEDIPALLVSTSQDGVHDATGPWRHRTKDGTEILVRISSHRVPLSTVDARHVMALDVTAEEDMMSQLRHQAFHDSLTALPNRALLLDRLTVMLRKAERSGSMVAVLFCDLDGFKPINDSLGHAIGDQLLYEAGHRFSGTLRPGDTLARLGGDEFVAVCEIDDERVAIQLAERLGAAVAHPMELEGHQVRVSTSVGISIGYGLALSPDELVRNADIAMYRAKSSGRGRFEIFDSGMHGRAVQRLAIEQDLRPGMGRDEFRLFYQPLFSAEDLRLVAFEALLRWEHPTRGMVPPGEFISVAEDSGFILTLGAWVIGEACRQLAAWRGEGAGIFKISVNLSARQLSDPGLVEYVASTLRSTGLPAESLVLEITETLLMSNMDASFSTLEALKKLGVGISVDDFGRGYSSLSYLWRVPLDSIKIDRSFVADLETDERARVLAATVVDLAHNLGVLAVAEGVETDRQFTILKDLGCDVMQGFLLGRPVPAGLVLGNLPAKSVAGRPGRRPREAVALTA